MAEQSPSPPRPGTNWRRRSPSFLPRSPSRRPNAICVCRHARESCGCGCGRGLVHRRRGALRERVARASSDGAVRSNGRFEAGPGDLCSAASCLHWATADHCAGRRGAGSRLRRAGKSTSPRSPSRKPHPHRWKLGARSRLTRWAPSRWRKGRPCLVSVWRNLEIARRKLSTD